MDLSKVKVTNNYLIIEPSDNTKTKNGIILQTERKLKKAKIIVGDNNIKNNTEIYYTTNSLIEIDSIDERKLFLINSRDILFYIEP